MKAYKVHKFLLIIYFMNTIAELKDKYDKTELKQNREFEVKIQTLF